MLSAPAEICSSSLTDSEINGGVSASMLNTSVSTSGAGAGGLIGARVGALSGKKVPTAFSVLALRLVNRVKYTRAHRPAAVAQVTQNGVDRGTLRTGTLALCQ